MPFRRELVVLACLTFAATNLRAGDAVAVAYNAEGLWSAVTYYCSSAPEGGPDYKDSVAASEAALRDLKRRAGENLAKSSVIASSDKTGNFAVARGKNTAGKETIVVGYGKSPADAERAALAKLDSSHAAKNQTVMYRYFSFGSDSKKSR